MNFKVVKIVHKSKKYKDKKGNEHCTCNYYLVLNDVYVAIRPSFSKGYVQLDTIAEVIVQD